MVQRIFAPNTAITGAVMAAAPSTIPPAAPRRGRLPSPVLGLALLATACSGDLSSVGSSISAGFDSLWSPFMGPTNVVASDSLTVQRVRGSNPAVEPLVPEAGNVWPAEEAPRPTLLGGPDEAMRNIPAYRPSLIDGAPAASSPVPTPGDQPAARPARRGSSTPPAGPGAPGDFARSPAAAAAPGALSPPPPRVEGRALTTPSGQAVTGTGGTGRVQGYTGPQGGGAVVRDGNVETWIGPDGRTSTRVVPN
ncbi:hypothetical protein [Falsiroseomonas ponticola]|jgi:hypothetical protein|uniref:hypothetical protein n=1 Tax=Falsiroseomonas ponticola TaxID=2786951 RepID=UPI001932E1FC|nr:hypothetical protein [Roseomonas ponticola]